VPGSRNSPRCGVCGSKLVKNGVTSAGRTRWRCKTCGSSTTQQRPDISRRGDLGAFTGWLLGKHSQAEYGGGTGRSLRSRIAWCWDITVPQPHPTGEVHRQIILDGTYFADWWVKSAGVVYEVDPSVGRVGQAVRAGGSGSVTSSTHVMVSTAWARVRTSSPR